MGAAEVSQIVEDRKGVLQSPTITMKFSMRNTPNVEPFSTPMIIPGNLGALQ